MPPAHTGLEKHKRLMRHRRQRVREAVVRKAGVRKVEHADVVTCGRGKDGWKAAVRRAGKGRKGQARPADFAGEGSDEGRFAAAGDPVEEVAATVRDAPVDVPLGASHELVQVRQPGLTRRHRAGAGGNRPSGPPR